MKITFSGLFKNNTLETQKQEISVLKNQVESLMLEKQLRGFDTFPYNTGGERTPGYPARRAKMTSTQLRDCYYTCGIIRAIVNGLSRVISCAKWDIISVDKEDPAPPETIKDVKDFFMNPNENSESLNYINAMLTNDLLVLDAGVIEKLMNGKEELGGFIARDASTFAIKRNKNGIIEGYYQENPGGGRGVPFDPEEIIYIVMYPMTNTAYGQPVMEALVNEMTTCLLNSRYARMTFDTNEIPPGILNLGKIGNTAYEAAKKEFQENKGLKAQNKLNVIYDTEKIEWVQLTRAARELEIDKLMTGVLKTIFSAFGITPTSMGSVEDVNRATAFVQENITKSSLINPILERLEYFYNTEMVWMHLDPSKKCMISFAKQDESTPEFNLNLARTMIPIGAMLIDEARDKFDLDPLPDGLGKQPIILSGMSTGLLEEFIAFKELPGQSNLLPEGEMEFEPEIIGKAFDEMLDIKTKDNEGLKAQLTYIIKVKPKTINIYHSILEQRKIGKQYQKEFKKTRGWFIKNFKENLKSGKNVNSLIEDAAKQVFKNLRRISESRFRDSFESGIESALKIFPNMKLNEDKITEKYSNLIQTEIIDIIRDTLIYGNEGFKTKLKRIISSYKERYGTSKIVKAEMKDEDYWLDEELVNAFAIIEDRLPRYAKKAETLTYEGLFTTIMESTKRKGGKLIMTTDDNKEEIVEERAWWITTSGRECPDCQKRSGESYPLDNIPYLPRDGTSVCHDNCYCVIEISKTKPAASLAGQFL